MSSLSRLCIGRHATDVERVYQLFGFGDGSPARLFGRFVRHCLPERDALAHAAIFSCLRCLAPHFCGSLCAVQVSLNLLHVCDYGTLEFRRFESSLDATRLVSWAHFCVCFVECFSASGEQMAAAFLTRPIEDSLRELQHAQERATPAELLDLMSDYCHPSLADFLQTHHSSSAAPSSATHTRPPSPAPPAKWIVPHGIPAPS